MDTLHNDDLILIDTYEGIGIYKIDYESAKKRDIEFTRQLIRENGGTPKGE